MFIYFGMFYYLGHKSTGWMSLPKRSLLIGTPNETRTRGGGYSLCDGWYICAAVLTPFFHFGRIEHDLFGVLFLIHQQQSYLLGYKNYQFLQKSIFLAANSIFSSIFLGPIFSGQRHTPISFQAEYPPRELECAASNGNRYPPYPQVMATAISQ